MVGRAVVRLVVMVVVMGRSKGGGREQEHAAEEEELLHSYQNDMNRYRLSAEIRSRIKAAIQLTGYCRDKDAKPAQFRLRGGSGAQAIFF